MYKTAVIRRHYTSKTANINNVIVQQYIDT